MQDFCKNPLPDHFLKCLLLVCMVRKARKTPYESAQFAKDRDTRFLKFLTWKMLRIVERSAELCDSTDLKQLEILRKRHNLLFGSKISLVESLVMLAELLIKLNQLSPEEEVKLSGGQVQSLSEVDIALINHFLTKERALALTS